MGKMMHGRRPFVVERETSVRIKDYDIQRELMQEVQAVLAIRRMSRADLARMIDVTPSAMTRYFGCERQLPATTFVKIVRALGVSSDTLLGEGDSSYSEKYEDMKRRAAELESCTEGSAAQDAESLASYFELAMSGVTSLRIVSKATGIPYDRLYSMYSRYEDAGKGFIYPEKQE